MKAFNTLFASSFLLIIAMLLPLQTAHAQQYEEGVDYVKISGIPETTKPVIREFFSYNCGHCYRQDPLFEETAHILENDVQFERTPVGAGRSSWILAKKLTTWHRSLMSLNKCTAISLLAFMKKRALLAVQNS